jgi:Zn-dependent M16 (insulinase) family peptidase
MRLYAKTTKFFIYPLLLLLLLSCSDAEKFEGYTLLEKRFVKEVNADCYFLEHNKTGARIFKIAADDPNKTFSISFKTIPENDCGTPHILEHAVLNGSKNFPVKSPFDVLAKGSLQTFLNAMTAKDRTMYPAASLNEKDYFNLMHVYYDAVFYPLIYDDPQIFQQEGWHHNLADVKDEIIYKGVVYNEMKGAFSSPTREMYYRVNKHMFPDNTYGFSSGGYPEKIPDLTYESFVDFHRKYYHPSNSFIFFYGDADLSDELTFIDTAYLANFDRAEINSQIPMHAPFSEMKEVTEYYSVPEGGNTDKQTYISLNFVIGDGTDQSMGMALDVLTDVLVNQESAPIRLALQDAGIGSNVDAWTYALRQHFMQITITNANPGDAEKAKEIVFSTLENLVAEGLDKESVEGTINRMEFGLREGDDANVGITLMSRHLPGWIHAGNPFIGIEYETPLAAVKQSLTGNYMEDIIQKELIDNPYKLLLVLEPKPGLENEKTAALNKKLSNYKKSLSGEEIEALVASTESLLAAQNKEDSPEALATIPMLSLEDIDPEAEWFEVTEKEVAGNKVLHFNEFSNSIVYAQFRFNLQVLPQEMIPYASIFRELMGKLDTENYSYAELEKALRIHTGGYSTVFETQLDSRENYALVPQLKVSAKATLDKSDKLFELAEEIMLRTDFSDTARLKTILTKQHANIESGIKSNGFGYTRKRLESYHSEKGVFSELTSGIEYYWFLDKLLGDYDKNATELVKKLENISALLYTKNNLDFGVTCTEDEYKGVEKLLTTTLNNFPVNEVEMNAWQLEPVVRNEGFMTASKVQYVMQGANLFDMGYEYSGKLVVLNKILTSDWLHKEVRVKGGAYGGFGYFLNTGESFFGSYRDPNLTNTMEAYAGTTEFIKNYETDSTEMIRSIIGTISWLDYPWTPSQKGNAAINRYYNGFTQQEAQTRRDEVLSATIDDIRALAPLVNDLLDQNTYCVYGNQEIIQANKDLFKSIRTIVK